MRSGRRSNNYWSRAAPATFISAKRCRRHSAAPGGSQAAEQLVIRSELLRIIELQRSAGDFRARRGPLRAADVIKETQPTNDWLGMIIPTILCMGQSKRPKNRGRSFKLLASLTFGFVIDNLSPVKNSSKTMKISSLCICTDSSILIEIHKTFDLMIP